jgi:hypothetical protein
MIFFKFGKSKFNIFLVFSIFENDKLFIGQAWKIVLKNIPKIHYYEVDRSFVQGGGYNKKYREQTYGYNGIDYGKVMDWDFHKIIKNKKNKSRKRKTRKNTGLF